MEDSFDPYSEWLDIPPGARPPDHYTLLGLEPLASDQQAIAHAADVRMAKIRKIRPGDHLREWGRMLDQLNAVKVCLSDPKSKAAYDASLADSLPASDPSGAKPKSSAPSYESPPSYGSRHAASIQEPPASAPVRQPPTSASPAEKASSTPGLLPVAIPLPAGLAPEAHPQTAVPPSLAAPGETDAAQEPASGEVPAGQMVAVPTPLETAAVVPLADAQPIAAEPVTTGFPQLGAAGQPATSVPRQSPKVLLSVLLAIAVVGLSAWVTYRLRRGDQPPDSSTQQDPAESPPSRPEPEPHFTPERLPPAEPAKTPPNPIPPRQPTRPIEEPARVDLATNDPAHVEPRQPQADPHKKLALAEGASELRFALSQRDLTAARDGLQELSPHAQDTADQELIARLETMVNLLEEFWRGMAQSCESFEGASELVLGDTRIAVVEGSRNGLVVKASGRVHRWTLKEMPTPVVLAVCDQTFIKGPANDALIGAFLAVDPKGDRARARRLWQGAVKGGLDLQLVMPELELDPSGSGGPKIPTPTGTAGLKQAGQSVRKAFAKDFAAATDDANKRELAGKLVNAAMTSGDPNERFVMLREARDLAAASGDGPLSLEAIDRMAKFYSFDVLQAKADAMEQVAKKSRTLQQRREIVMRTLDFSRQAAAQDRLDTAQRLATLALDVARKTHNLSLMKQANEEKRRVEKLRRR